MIRGLKIGVTKWIRKNTDIYKVWQRNYYEHIIRDEDDLNRIENIFVTILKIGITIDYLQMATMDRVRAHCNVPLLLFIKSL